MNRILKFANISIESIRVQCPYCYAVILNSEGNHSNKTVCIPEGEKECPDCHKLFRVVDIDKLFGVKLYRMYLDAT